MSLNDLTAASINQALQEFDEIGRDAFLKKYGFGKARSYFIAHAGKQYDSKAIVGAAHSYLGPSFEAMTTDDFSGGEATVATALRRIGFDVINTEPRNPNRVRDELILALAFYLQHRENMPDKASEEIEALSSEINKLGAKIGLSGGTTFRNANGVYMKLMNFRRLDPLYTAEGKVGLQRGGKGEEIVWQEFANDPVHLVRVADAIRSGLSDGQFSEETAVEDDPDFTEAEEGRLLTRVHRQRERNRKLVLSKKKSFMKEHGRVFCEACGFDFEKRYGQRGFGFIECHHTKPVHTLRLGAKTNLEDLKLLCANCHRMVHAKSPWLSFDELKNLLNR